MGRLDGKVAIVTGAGRGQGRAHAIALAREGADVVACGIEHDLGALSFELWSPGDLDQTVALVEAEDQRALKVAANTADIDDMQRVADAAIEEFGRIDIMVANAGVVAYNSVQEMTKAEWDVVIDVNLTGVWNSLKVCAQQFIDQRSGCFIATSSAGVGKSGAGNNSNYGAAKWGVIGLVKCAAIDLGPYNVRCNAICPGYVSTPLLNNEMTTGVFFPGDDSKTMEDVDDVITGMHHWLPGGRLDPSEISKAVVFLASDDAQYISGSTIDVSAGMAAIYTA